ncbi:MAG: hypothetical protein CMJ78_07050 [Planctomycetaceae bacterium]|nr:hypothetical protein [Planctomycetaceae bacterium]
MSICDGRTVRDLLGNAFHEILIQAGHELTIFTEAVLVPEFVDAWSRPEIRFRRLLPCQGLQRAKRLMQLRMIAGKKWLPGSNRFFRRVEQRFGMSSRSEYITALQEDNINAYLATHINLPREQELLQSARRLKIPTVGLVRSWDNIFKGLRARPERIAVWNEVNKTEAIDFENYCEDEITIVGAPQFDGYFQDETCSREEFMQRHNLDPNRRLILFATLGHFIPDFDESCWMEMLMKAIDSGQVEGRPQVICRLHPWSHNSHFARFASHPDVRMSAVDKYYPSLGWSMSREDVVEMANMIQHSDLVITPGSTVAIEAAIFDRPTLIPVFHPFQPEMAQEYFNTWILGKHFKHLVDENLVRIIFDKAQYAEDINRCFTHPNWYASARAELRRTYVAFDDGRSTERLAKLLMSMSECPTESLEKKPARTPSGVVVDSNV